jgi:hypothetical protein
MKDTPLTDSTGADRNALGNVKNRNVSEVRFRAEDVSAAPEPITFAILGHA